MKRRRFLFFGVLAVLASAAPSFAQTFTPTATPARADLSSWHLSGSATLAAPATVRMTDASGQSGAIWAPCLLDLRDDFHLAFWVDLGEGVAASDGMAFVLQNSASGVTALGSNGGGMGFGDLTASLGYDPSTGIHPSLAVELDTNYNDEMTLLGEPFYDHLAVVKDGLLENQVVVGPVMAAPSPTPGILSNGVAHRVDVYWTAASHTMILGLDTGSAIVCTQDLVNDIFGGVPRVYWGWTAGTGSYATTQSLSSLSGCPSPTPTATPLPNAGNKAFLYPNPIAGKVGHLAYHLESESKVTVKVFNSAYDLSAKFGDSGAAGDHVMDLDLTAASPGVYYVLVEVETSAGKKKKLPILSCYLPGRP